MDAALDDKIPPEPGDFEDIMDLDNEEVRNERARGLPYPSNKRGTKGNGPSAQINKILWEEDERCANDVANPPDQRPEPNPNLPRQIPNFRV